MSRHPDSGPFSVDYILSITAKYPPVQGERAALWLVPGLLVTIDFYSTKDNLDVILNSCFMSNIVAKIEALHLQTQVLKTCRKRMLGR